MRQLALVILLACSLSAGCIQAGIEAIDEARQDRRAREGESTEAPGPLGPPTPTGRVPTATPTPATPTSPTVPASPTVPTVAPASPTVPASPTTPASPTVPATPTAPGVPSEPVAPWPRAGSFVQLEADTWNGPRAVRVWANWTYDGDEWSGTCEGLAQGVTYSIASPPHWPLFNTREVPRGGGDVRIWYLDECTISNGTARYDGVAGARHAASTSEPRMFHTEWDARTGLVLGWDMHEGASGGFGRLVATDAPTASPLGYEAPHG